MAKNNLLIVDDDHEVSNMLDIYFTGLGYNVEILSRGADALQAINQRLPHLVLLEVELPDMQGYDICRAIRSNTRSSLIPIIFLSRKSDRIDKLHGFESGADDYITKPFDIEELRLRVQRRIERFSQKSLTDSRSGLPAGKLIEEQLRRIIQLPGWTYLDLRINYFEPFREAYGFLAGDDVIRFLTYLIWEVIEEFGNPDDFVGHAGGGNFVMITSQGASPGIIAHLKSKFDSEVLSHYNFIDRERGYIVTFDGVGGQKQAPMMTLSVGAVSPAQHKFSDIREITELAVQARQNIV